MVTTFVAVSKVINPAVAVSVFMESGLTPVPNKVATDGLVNFIPWVTFRVRPVTVSTYAVRVSRVGQGANGNEGDGVIVGAFGRAAIARSDFLLSAWAAPGMARAKIVAKIVAVIIRWFLIL
jgi:hypothetical protein